MCADKRWHTTKHDTSEAQSYIVFGNILYRKPDYKALHTSPKQLVGALLTQCPD